MRVRLLRDEWERLGRPILSKGSMNQEIVSPLLRAIGEAEMLADRLRRALLKRHRGPEPSAVLRLDGRKPPSRRLREALGKGRRADGGMAVTVEWNLAGTGCPQRGGVVRVRDRPESQREAERGRLRRSDGVLASLCWSNSTANTMSGWTVATRPAGHRSPGTPSTFSAGARPTGSEKRLGDQRYRRPEIVFAGDGHDLERLGGATHPDSVVEVVAAGASDSAAIGEPDLARVLASGSREGDRRLLAAGANAARRAPRRTRKPG